MRPTNERLIKVPGYLIVGLAAFFSVYHLVLATVSMDSGFAPVRYVAAMVLYTIATVASLWPSSEPRMSLLVALYNTAVAIAIPIMVTSQLPAEYVVGAGYSTWYVAAIGTLMVIMSARRRHFLAALGVLSLVVQTVLWAGFGALASIGVIGSVLWVAVTHVLSRSLDKAGHDARAYALAEREATDWQAAQEAHLFERRFRLGQTGRMALPMLRRIAASQGELTEVQRQECLYLEGAIRDEIRGRKLLSDRVRHEVMVARRRGTVVNLLDEGGLDDLDEDELERVHNALAAVIRDTPTDLIIARTVPEGSAVAVTVVGLRSNGESAARALGQHSDDEDEIDLWLEIPRESVAQ
ncbi:MAG: hypothetical protein JWR57_963 [Mycetocola sp.]|nr:hypothetical protein [Mycetocola sp.]